MYGWFSQEYYDHCAQEFDELKGVQTFGYVYLTVNDEEVLVTSVTKSLFYEYGWKDTQYVDELLAYRRPGTKEDYDKLRHASKGDKL